MHKFWDILPNVEHYSELLQYKRGGLQGNQNIKANRSLKVPSK